MFLRALLVGCSVMILRGSVEATCPESDQVHCFTTSRCTRIRYICDGDNDCGDNSDEESALCRLWNNSDCDRNSAQCTRNGRTDCVTITHYCSLNDPPCNGTLDLRICEMLKLEKLIPINSVTPPTAAAPTEPTPEKGSVHEREDDLVQEVETRMSSTMTHEECPKLFTLIGEQCVSVFYLGMATWIEARTFCKMLDSDLLVITPENFITVMQHLRSTQVSADFWVGGRQYNSSSPWKWVDNTDITLGSPFWAVRHSDNCMQRTITSPSSNETELAAGGKCFHQVQAPQMPAVGACAAINYANYYYVSDEVCSTRKSPLCAKVSKGPKQAL